MHADDGTLNAWLDGALVGEQAEELRAHLAVCAACRNRRDEAARLRDEAGAILAGATPRFAPAPGFDELLARARAREAGAPAPASLHRRARPRRLPRRALAWAATIALALAGGWWARGLIRPAAPVALAERQAAPNPAPAPGAAPASEPLVRPSAGAPAAPPQTGSDVSGQLAATGVARPATGSDRGYAVVGAVSGLRAGAAAQPAEGLEGGVAAAPAAVPVPTHVLAGVVRAGPDTARPGAGLAAAGTVTAQQSRAEAARAAVAPAQKLAAKDLADAARPAAVAAPAGEKAARPQPDTTPAVPAAERAAAKEAFVSAENVEAAPTFTPYTVAPALRNRAEVQRALADIYPSAHPAGTGTATVRLWLLVDADGRVLETQLRQSSGSMAADAAATRVARIMRFTPALNRDTPVRVWVEVPIIFRAREPQR